MTDEFPWPRLGDVLFTHGDDWHNACIGWTHGQWSAYAEGYKRAAEILVQHVVEAQRDHNFLIYPIVFLYRQAIEISLKHLIWTGCQLVDRRQSIPAHHRLVPLWQQCRAIIEQVWPGGPKQDLDAVSEVMDQFEARAPVSTVFRYPFTKEGRASLPANGLINIPNFAEVANRVISLLDGCACGFSEYLQSKWEMEREFSG
jgi:hypothetical protein